jgi:hypothetical protein
LCLFCCGTPTPTEPAAADSPPSADPPGAAQSDAKAPPSAVTQSAGDPAAPGDTAAGEADAPPITIDAATAHKKNGLSPKLVAVEAPPLDLGNPPMRVFTFVEKDEKKDASMAQPGPSIVLVGADSRGNVKRLLRKSAKSWCDSGVQAQATAIEPRLGLFELQVSCHSGADYYTASGDTTVFRLKDDLTLQRVWSGSESFASEFDACTTSTDVGFRVKGDVLEITITDTKKVIEANFDDYKAMNPEAAEACKPYSKSRVENLPLEK